MERGIHMTYKPQGVCAQKIDFDIVDGKEPAWNSTADVTVIPKALPV